MAERTINKEILNSINEFEQTRYDQQYQDMSQKQMTESNLPVRNNGFSRFFSQMRSRFFKQLQNKNTKK